MSDEITITQILHVSKGYLEYGPEHETDTEDMTGTKGPSPGYVSATTTGTTVDLSALTTPATCKIKNLDTTNFVTYGPYSGGTFYPLGELLPGRSAIIRLSRTLAALRLVADTATCGCTVEAFDA